MDVSEAKRLRERENAELKKMVAKQALDIRMLKDLNSKKMVSLVEQRRGAEYLEAEHGVSERRACQVIGIWRSLKRRPSGRIEEAKFVRRVHELTERYPRFGYRKIHAILGAEGLAVGRDRLRLIRKREGLPVLKKQRKRRRAGQSTTEEDRALYPNHVWSYDFVSDHTVDGRRLRLLTVIDEFTREAIWIECARLLNSHDVIRVLNPLVESRGHPRIIKSDNGPEIVAERIQDWIKKRPTDTYFIEPGSPWQNGHNESFNGVLRDGCLDRWALPRCCPARTGSVRHGLAYWPEFAMGWLVALLRGAGHGALQHRGCQRPG